MGACVQQLLPIRMDLVGDRGAELALGVFARICPNMRRSVYLRGHDPVGLEGEYVFAGAFEAHSQIKRCAGLLCSHIPSQILLRFLSSPVKSLVHQQRAQPASFEIGQDIKTLDFHGHFTNLLHLRIACVELYVGCRGVF